MTPLQIVIARGSCVTETAQLHSLLDLAEARTDLEAYGANRSDAVALLVLHWMAVQDRGRAGAAGPITAEAEGQLSRSYGFLQNQSLPPHLSQTAWGLELIGLRRASIVGFRNRRIKEPIS